VNSPSPSAPQAGPPADGDSLKLTTYFGERDRTADGLLADRLLDLYEQRAVPTSILLRGAEGFGATHRLRTDRLLTLSEDLPVVSIALDARERIESLLGPLLQIKHRGLVTLERTRMLSGAISPPELPEKLDEATKLTVYVGRHERTRGKRSFAAAVDLLHRRGISGASVLLGVDGTRAGHRTRAKFFSPNSNVSTMIVAVGSGPQIADVTGELSELLDHPPGTFERVRICKRDGRLLATPHELPGTDEHGLSLWQKLTIYTSESATHEGHAIHLQIVRRLRESGAAGATSLRGIWGFHGDHPPHGDRLLQVRRHVPVLTSVIDTPERISRAFEIVDELTREHGLVTSEMVPALSELSSDQTIGGLRLAQHDF
jgi:PII-like signaling protein